MLSHLILLSFVDSGNRINEYKITVLWNDDVEHMTLLGWRVLDVQVNECLGIRDFSGFEFLAGQPALDGTRRRLPVHDG